MKEFDDILNKRVYKMVCRKCGTWQSHKLVHCKSCGTKYEYMPKNLIDALRVIYNRLYQNRLVLTTPSYVSAIYCR